MPIVCQFRYTANKFVGFGDWTTFQIIQFKEIPSANMLCMLKMGPVGEHNAGGGLESCDRGAACITGRFTGRSIYRACKEHVDDCILFVAVAT